MGKIALNVMGGDHAPAAMIEGAQLAAEQGYEVILVGDQADIKGVSNDFETIVTTENIAFDVADPALAYRSSKDNPVKKAAQLVRDGQADAFVDCGNTAVTLTGATVTIGRIRGVRRPAIPVLLPRITNVEGEFTIEQTLLLDAGANKEVDPAMLGQFGVMGSLYMELVSGIPSPTVGILSNGAETEKGTDLVKEASRQLQALAHAGLVNYVGHVEGNDLFNGGVDVAVTDGFNGNLILKSVEGVATMMGGFIIGAFMHDLETQAALEVMRPHLRVLKTALDPNQVGGALLLGVKGVAIIGHGSSNATAVAGAIEQAYKAHHSGIIEKFSERIAKARVLESEAK
jgi:glycerol-3-phosphate acyltransferase PlsX